MKTRDAIQPPSRPGRGFTLIELMIVIAIIGILATLAIPSFQDRIIRAQVSEGIALADFARQSVAAYYAKTHTMPRDNAAAGLPPADHILGTYVSGMQIKEGTIVITYGGKSNRFIAGKTLALRPATVPGYPQVPLSWVCGLATAADKMVTASTNDTTLAETELPIDCRKF